MMFVTTVFKSSFCFSYVILWQWLQCFIFLFLMYHVKNVFRVTAYMMSDMSSFAGRMKLRITRTSVCYVVAC